MKAILTTLTLVIAGLLANAQKTPEDFLKKAPALPKDSCSISRNAVESFTQSVASLIEEVENEISTLNEKVNAGGKGNEELAKEAALKQMSQQYGMSEEDVAKLKNAKNLSKADKEALANNMVMQQTNMSMDELKNLSKMDDAAKKAYTEAYATEMMANAQANPNQKPPANTSADIQQLLAAQQAATANISAYSQKIAYLYSSIESDTSGRQMLRKIDNWHNKLMSMTGIDYGQGKQMDSLSVLIQHEQIKYCNKFTPKYRSAVRQHYKLVMTAIPDYRELGTLSAEVYKMQYGIVIPPESAELGALQAVKEYLDRLKESFKYTLYFSD